MFPYPCSNHAVTCSGVICMTWNLISKTGEALISCPVCLVHSNRLSSPFNKSDPIPFQLYIKSDPWAQKWQIWHRLCV